MTPAEHLVAAVPPKILIAEDSPTQAQRLRHILAQHRYQVQAAVNGREALELAALDTPALIISDVVMPEMDGYELTRRVKANPALRDIPVILVTTMSDPQDVIRGLECGADCFILKPYDEQHLISRIQYILLNRAFRQRHDSGMGVEIHFNGQRHYITADRLQILNLLLSTYDAAIQRNQELSASQVTLERKKAEVEAGHRFLDSVIENIPIAVFMKDARDLRFVRINRAAEALMGCPREQMLGKTATGMLSAGQMAGLAQRSREMLASGAVIDIPVEQITTYDKGVRSVHTRMVPVLDADGEASHLLIMCDDITDSVRADAELKALNAKLKAVNAELVNKTIELARAGKAAEEATLAKSAFLAMMSHEIRTPMNGVIGMVDVLHQTSLKGDQVEMVDLIRESAFSLLGIIEDILDFSKIEAGKLELETAPMAPAAVVEKACSLLDTLARKKEVELTVFADPGLPALVMGDGLRVRQVLINIVNNAIKFSGGRPCEPGHVAVRATASAIDGEQIALELRVTDNGIGMDEQTQARLFTSFSQADVSTTRRFGGTGLGLAISDRLVKLMGGHIHVSSTPGEGSTFVVHLPCTPLPSELAAPASPLVQGLCCLVVGPPGGLADDHASYLVYGGAEVTRVPDLAQAREWSLARASGLVLWLVDIGDKPSSMQVLQQAALMPPERDLRIRVVAIERGRRRVLRPGADGIALVDGNVLTRARLFKCVAQAAGRAGLERLPQTPQPNDKPLGPPSREEAIRRRQLTLVTEDNETNQKVVLRQLGLLGIAADVVGDGQTALTRWRSGDYSLLITDLHMPVMDGYQLTRAIRAEESDGQRIPIVALSANAIKDEALRCISLGMDDYLSKPAQLTDLRQMLEKWLPTAPMAAGAVPGPGSAATTASQHEPVDVHVLEALVGDDPAVVAEFLQDFLLRARQNTTRIRAAVLAGDCPAVEAEAHKLKSSARSAGALRLGELCDELEQVAHAGGLDALRALLPRFEAEMGRVEQQLDSR